MEKKKKVNMKQIAEQLQLSPGTVSLTLNGRGDEMRISIETQRLIFETAKQMGYPLERIRKKQQTVGIAELPVVVVLMPILSEDIVSPYDRIMHGLKQCIQEDGATVEIMVCPFTYGALKEKYRYISRRFCSGVIITSMSESDMDELQNHDFDIPIVVFNRLNKKYPTIYTDDYQVGYQVAKSIKEKGCKSAALVTPNYKNKPLLLRKMGFENGCSDFGIQLPEHHNIICQPNYKEIEWHISQLCESQNLPDIFFANMDDIGVGIVLALENQNISIPEDIEVIAYGDHTWVKQVVPSMTTIRMDVEAMSRECLKMLWHMIETGDWTPVAKIFR